MAFLLLNTVCVYVCMFHINSHHHYSTSRTPVSTAILNPLKDLDKLGNIHYWFMLPVKCCMERRKNSFALLWTICCCRVHFCEASFSFYIFCFSFARVRVFKSTDQWLFFYIRRVHGVFICLPALFIYECIKFFNVRTINSVANLIEKKEMSLKSTRILTKNLAINKKILLWF